MSPCPHCRATAVAEPSAALRWRCGVCGGPVVPSDGSFPRKGGELASLVGASRAHAMAFGWTAAAIVLGAGGLLTLPLVLLLWHVAHAAAIVLAVVAAAALVLASAGAARARKRRAETRAKIDEAWTTVAGELLAARGDRATAVTAADVARALQTDDAFAEALLSELSAEGRVRVAVGDDAQLSYRPDPGGENGTEASPVRQASRRDP